MISLVGNNLTAGYGGVDIIKDINLEVKQGDEFNAQLKQGTLRAKVIETKDNEK